jgi:hypothetical protein
LKVSPPISAWQRLLAPQRQFRRSSRSVLRLLVRKLQLRSEALENFRASHPSHAAIRADVCRDPSGDNGRRADKTSRPDCGRSAICRPVPRRLEHEPRASNAPCQIIGNSRTGARWTANENSGEISRRVDRQNLQQRTPLTLPNGGEQTLGRRSSGGCEKKKQSRNDTGHVLLHLVVVNF